MARGDAIHKEAEAYVRGTLTRLPMSLKLVKDDATYLRKFFKSKPESIWVEDQWAFNNRWEATGWFSPDCWVRIKVDVAHIEEDNIVTITDWKSGKFRQDNLHDYLEQLELYALGALSVFGSILETDSLIVRPRLVYVDAGIVYPEPGALEFSMENVEELKSSWGKKTKKMLTDKKFEPTPNRYCYSCHYRANNAANGGGQCKY